MNDISHQQQLLTPEDVAGMLGITPRTLQDWRLKGYGPKPVFLTARTVRYRLPEVENWIEKRAKEGIK